VVLVTSAFDTWRVYGILKILRSAHVSDASRRESRYFVVTHHQHTSPRRINYLLEFYVAIFNAFMEKISALTYKKKGGFFILLVYASVLTHAW